MSTMSQGQTLSFSARKLKALESIFISLDVTLNWDHYAIFIRRFDGSITNPVLLIWIPLFFS